MSRLGKPTTAAVLTLALAIGAHAQTAGPSPEPDHMPPPGDMTHAEMDKRAVGRSPQPVRVGDLVGRELLEPLEWQPVVGRVDGLVRREDGTADMIVRLDGRLGLLWLGVSWIDWAGFGPRSVRVPVAAVALLGEYVGLMDLTPERLRALPDAAAGSAPGIGPDETIRVGIVRPFH